MKYLPASRNQKPAVIIDVEPASTSPKQQSFKDSDNGKNEKGSIIAVALIILGIVALLSFLSFGGWNWIKGKIIAANTAPLIPPSATLATGGTPTTPTGPSVFTPIEILKKDNLGHSAKYISLYVPQDGKLIPTGLTLVGRKFRAYETLPSGVKVAREIALKPEDLVISNQTSVTEVTTGVFFSEESIVGFITADGKEHQVIKPGKWVSGQMAVTVKGKTVTYALRRDKVPAEHLVTVAQARAYHAQQRASAAAAAAAAKKGAPKHPKSTKDGKTVAVASL